MRLLSRLSAKISLLVLLFAGIVAFNPGPKLQYESDAMSTAITASLANLEVAYDEYDILLGAFKTQKKTIKRNETFSDMLSQFGIPALSIARLVDKAKPVLDIRKMRAGNTYTVYTDSLTKEAQFLVYEKDPVDYVVFDLRDSLVVSPGERAITTVRKTVSGAITSSLYETLAEQKATPMLAIELSEIFAWQVDFYRIMKGDGFSVIYDEQFVGDKSIGVGDIIGVKFHHSGRDYYAFPHELDGRTEYYNHEGNSLRRPFLRAPLRFNRISSRYSLRRFHPVQKRYKAHLGTDYAAPTGTPIRATADGVVVEAGYAKYNGRYVKIRHNSTYTTGYLHMSKIQGGIKKGVKVSQGDVIGYVGSTGLATGPHLCYRFWKNGKQVDALREKLPETIEPINEAYREAFLAQVQAIKPQLD